ncbi:hypothetical protein DYB34_000500 [Aphanomyces astaci]|uniref:Tubby C-terminal domain-containing protein n=1 Tax=Aphanomyces astaci TaxID=112090 RepID=A0A3R6XD38_APHAT|nr:hypothetical protein DYB34_000500 [Aphanomyces astaci]
MALRAAPLSSSRHSNQKGFFKDEAATKAPPALDHSRSGSTNKQTLKPAWVASATTASEQGENQVIPFSFDEDDYGDERDGVEAKGGTTPSDSEFDNDSGSDSECQVPSKDDAREETDSSDAKSKDQPNNSTSRDASASSIAPPKSKSQLAALDTKSLESAAGCNQSADVEFSPLHAPLGSMLTENKLVLLAEKQLHNRTSNYHIFDMSRGGCTGQKLTKKSGNYVGKLRSNFGKHENVMVSAQAERSELGAILFEAKVSSTKPRKLTVVCPPLSSQNEVISQGAKPDTFSTLLDQHKADKRVTEHLTVLENKEPEYEKGCYRLNFNGRVSIPSVKNFQLVVRGHAAKGIVLQFGKVSDKLFHLDFKHPLTPFQAFAIALSQRFGSIFTSCNFNHRRRRREATPRMVLRKKHVGGAKPTAMGKKDAESSSDPNQETGLSLDEYFNSKKEYTVQTMKETSELLEKKEATKLKHDNAMVMTKDDDDDHMMESVDTIPICPMHGGSNDADTEEDPYEDDYESDSGAKDDTSAGVAGLSLSDYLTGKSLPPKDKASSKKPPTKKQPAVVDENEIEGMSLESYLGAVPSSMHNDDDKKKKKGTVAVKAGVGAQASKLGLARHHDHNFAIKKRVSAPNVKKAIDAVPAKKFVSDSDVLHFKRDKSQMDKAANKSKGSSTKALSHHTKGFHAAMSSRRKDIGVQAADADGDDHGDMTLFHPLPMLGGNKSGAPDHADDSISEDELDVSRLPPLPH